MNKSSLDSNVKIINNKIKNSFENFNSNCYF